MVGLTCSSADSVSERHGLLRRHTHHDGAHCLHDGRGHEVLGRDEFQPLRRFSTDAGREPLSPHLPLPVLFVLDDVRLRPAWRQNGRTRKIKMVPQPRLGVPRAISGSISARDLLHISGHCAGAGELVPDTPPRPCRNMFCVAAGLEPLVLFLVAQRRHCGERAHKSRTCGLGPPDRSSRCQQPKAASVAHLSLLRSVRSAASGVPPGV